MHIVEKLFSVNESVQSEVVKSLMSSNAVDLHGHDLSVRSGARNRERKRIQTVTSSSNLNPNKDYDKFMLRYILFTYAQPWTWRLKSNLLNIAI